MKTNAQVNEVLDNRSIIKCLQRELAKAKPNGMAPSAEHVWDWENKAATAGTAALPAKTKIDRIMASILNMGILFDDWPELFRWIWSQRWRQAPIWQKLAHESQDSKEVLSLGPQSSSDNYKQEEECTAVSYTRYGENAGRVQKH